MKPGIAKGRRPVLVVEVCFEAFWGWSEVKKIWFKGQDRLKGDERILGDSCFMVEVLSEADEKHYRRYELESKGYDLERLEQRVSEICQI